MSHSVPKRRSYELRGRPGVGGGLFGGNRLVHAAVARAVILQAFGRIQIYGFEWPHKGPAQAQAVLDGNVQILGADAAAIDQAKRLAQQSSLQADRKSTRLNSSH